MFLCSLCCCVMNCILPVAPCASWLLCVCVCVCFSMTKKWQPRRWEGQRLSFLHTLRETLLEKLRRSRSFGDLAALRPRSRSSLEVYVSQVTVCPAVLSEVCVSLFFACIFCFNISHTRVSSHSHSHIHFSRLVLLFKDPMKTKLWLLVHVC